MVIKNLLKCRHLYAHILGVSSSDISEITKSFDLTTEGQAEESSKEGEDDYEIVPTDSCDDGEWVDVAGVYGVQFTNT